MQINTDISPIISPKSNFSNSFISPRDVLFSNMNSNKFRTSSVEKSPNENNGTSQGDNPHGRTDLEASQHGNTTNESYSVDRNFGRNNSNHIGSLSSQHYVNETNRESDNSRNIENMQLIEYEEFCVDRSKKDSLARNVSEFSSTTNSPFKPQEDVRNPNEETNKQPEVDNQIKEQIAQVEMPPERNDKELPSPKNTAKKFLFNFMDGKSKETDSGPMIKSNSTHTLRTGGSTSATRRRQDPSDLPLQDSHHRHSSNIVDISKGENSINKEPLSMKTSFHLEVEPKNDIEVERNGIRSFNDLKEQVRDKDDEIGYLKARVRYLEEKRAEKVEASKTKIEQQQKNQLVNTKDHKETSTESLENIEHEERQKIMDELLAKNEQLKQDMNKIMQDLEEKNIEACEFKDKAQKQDELIEQMEERFIKYDETILSLENDVIKKEQEIRDIEEKYKELVAKKSKLKSLLRQRDQTIIEVKQQCEDVNNKFAQSELNPIVTSKSKAYKEKINQLQKHIQEQKEIIKQKDSTIDNLLDKMDSLTGSKEEKSNEVMTLKNEVRYYQEQLETMRKDQKTASNMSQSHKSSTDNLHQHLREKSSEKLAGLTRKLENLDARVKESNPAKRQTADYYSLISHDNTAQKQTNPDLRANIRHINKETIAQSNYQDSMDYDVSKARSEIAEARVSIKKPVLKSSDPNIRSENEKEIQNIEDLQKRLAYLKNKRVEFEKRKQTRQTSRDDLNENCNELVHAGHSSALNSCSHSIISPLVTLKKSEDAFTAFDRKNRDSASSRINNYVHMDDYSNTTGREQIIRNQSNYSDGNNSRPTSKTRPPKIENHQQFNRSESTSYISSVKSGVRYASLSNNPSSVRHEASTTKNQKKSYDSNSNPNSRGTDVFKFSDSPNKHSGAQNRGEQERSSSRSKDIRDFFPKSSVTPNNQIHSRLMEKLTENKSRK